jgi:hypothetical protein
MSGKRMSQKKMYQKRERDRMTSENKERCGRLWIFLCCVMLLQFLVSAAPVSGQLSVVPLMQEVSVNRGGRTHFQLQVANRGEESVSCAMQVYDMDISEEGIPLAIREEVESGCTDWITFEPKSFDLHPDEVQIVEGLIHAPMMALGGFYAFMTCEFNILSEPILFGDQQRSRADIQLARAVSSILLGTVRSSKNSVQLEPDSLVLESGRGSSAAALENWSQRETGKLWQVILPVENTGNVHTVAQGEVSVWTEDVRLVDKATLAAGRGYVLPGKRRMFRAQGAKSLADGIYMVKIQLRTREGRFVQGSFPYSIVKGKAKRGAVSDAMRALIEASTPKFSLSKRLLDYKVTPKGKRTKGIRLNNHTSDTLSVSARTIAWSMDNSGQVVLHPEKSEMTKPCMSWIEVSPNPVSIPPQRSSAVKISLLVPSDIVGEYYGGVIFETADTRPDLPTELEFARTLFIMAAASKDLEYKVDIQSFVHDPVSPMMRTFAVNIANQGNVHCFASGKVEIYDQDWKLVMEPIAFGGPQSYILPERTREFVVPCPGALEPGKYEAVATVKYDHETAPVAAKVYFNSGGH